MPQQIPESQIPTQSEAQPERSPTSPTTDTSVSTPNSTSQASIPSNASIDLLPDSTQSSVPQSPVSPSPSILQSGDSGSEVQALQEQLTQLGYYDGPISGVYDRSTQDAVIRFQQASGMGVDGMVGAQTATALQSAIDDRSRLVQPPEPPPVPAEPPSVEPSTVLVTRIEVTGSTVFSSADFAPIVQSLEGQSITLEELQSAANAITQLYLDRGYATSRAVLIDQTITNGVVNIQVIEGSLERIDVEGTQTVNPDDVRRIVERGVSVPLNVNDLDSQLRLLQADARFTNVGASLNAGTRIGQSILVIRVTEANNTGTPSFLPPGVPSRRSNGTR